MHKIYGALIITALTHLFAELGALYTLTHMETVPAWINRGVHQVFLILFLVIFYEVYLYIFAMIEEERKEQIKKNVLEKFNYNIHKSNKSSSFYKDRIIIIPKIKVERYLNFKIDEKYY